jgi:hypothetical protein
VNGNKLGKDMLSKMKTSVVVAALLLAVSAHAKDTGIAAPAKINVAAIQASLSELPGVEIPVRASELMKAAPKEAKVETAKAILKSVLEQRPQMAIQLVASLAKASPESAGQISTLALAIVPQYGDAIIRVAAVNAPQYAAEIAAAAVAAYPASQSDVIKWISLAVPSAATAINSAVERQVAQDQYVRLVSEALGQNSGGGGNISSIKETLSSIIAGNSALQTLLQSGLQAQLDQQAKTAGTDASVDIPKGGSQEVEIVKKTVEVKVVNGLIQIIEKVVSREKITVTKNPDGSVVQSQPVTVPPQAGDGQDVVVADVVPSAFPDPNEVVVQQGQAGADTVTRIEEAAKQAAEKYNG